MNSNEDFANVSQRASCSASTSSTSYSNENVESADAKSDSVPLAVLDGVFFKYVPAKSSDRHLVGQCVKCLPKNVEIKGYIKSSSNFVSHLKRKHGPEAIVDYQKHLELHRSKRKKATRPCSSETEVTETTGPNHTYSQEEVDKDLVIFFINSMIPLRAIDDQYFRRMINKLTPSDHAMTIPGRRALTRKISEQYAQQMCNVKEMLKLAKYVCTTADIWSGKKRSFLGVIVHWIDENLQRKSAAIACRRFRGAHTYDRIKDILLEVYADYELNVSKVVATVTDNGSNFVKAFKVFGVKTKSIVDSEVDNEPIEFDESDDDSAADQSVDNPLSATVDTMERNDETQTVSVEDNMLSDHMRCCAHTLNLTASADVQSLLNNNATELGKMHAEVMKKCNELWNAAGRPKSAEIIQNILGHTLSRPGATRWNSVFDSLQQISRIRDKIVPLSRALGLKNPHKDADFDYIEEHLRCAAPIADALDIMQGDDTFYGIVLPCLLALQRKLRKLSEEELKWCKPLASKYLESTETRFSTFYKLTDENAIIAALSHPRFKKKWFSCVLPDQHKRCTNLLKSAICSEISRNEFETENNAHVKSREDDFFDFSSDSGSETQSSNCPKRRAESIMSGFFAEESRDINLLHRHPFVKNVFIQYNTPMPSSGPVERMFSFATMTNLPKSHRLSDHMFEKRVVMKTNLNYSQQSRNCIG